MGKKLLIFLNVLLFFSIPLQTVCAVENSKTVIFFYSTSCPSCQTAEKYLLEEEKKGKILLLEFENSKFPTLRAEFDTAFEVEASIKNSIPLLFIGKQYLFGNSIKGIFEATLFSLKEENYDYPLIFLLNSKSYSNISSTSNSEIKQLEPPSQNNNKKATFLYLTIFSLIIFFLPLFYKRKKLF